MIQMIQDSLFTIPYWKIHNDNFEEKKKKLTKLLESYPEEKTGIAAFATNRHSDRSKLIGQFASIMIEELKALSKEIKKDFSIHEIWSVSYDKGDYQSIHNHGSMGLSGLLYLDLPKDSPTALYVQPWNDITDDTVQYLEITNFEGDIVIVPSFVMHFTKPNKSEDIKRIISWDMKIL
jgi:hypothetical protein